MSQPNENNNNNHDFKDRKIFVGNLAWRTTTAGLKSFFEQYGEVFDANVVCEILPRGYLKSKGYGFVTFKDAESAKRACEPPHPVIDERQTNNINLAYIGARNNTNQSNQNGLVYQPRPLSQYQNGLAYQPRPVPQYQNDSINQTALHQYQPISTNPYYPQGYWDSNYGVYRDMYNFPHPYSPTMIYPYGLPYGMQYNWYQSSIRQPVHISQPPRESRIEDITDNNQEEVSTVTDNREDVDIEANNIVDQQNEEDQEGEISGQEN